MKKITFWRIFSLFAVAAAALGFVACSDDDDDKDLPKLEVTPAKLTFKADGTADGVSAFTVKSNREWSLDIVTGSEWVTPSAVKGTGDSRVEISVPASNTGRAATLRFSLKNSYGAYLTREVTVEQGEAPSAGEISRLVEYIKQTWPSLETGTETLNYPNSTISGVILANNESGNHFGKLYVGDNIELPNSAIILYSTTDYTREASAAWPVGRRVTLDLSSAQYAPYGNLRELKGVVVTLTDDPAVDVVTPMLTASMLNTGDWQGQYVRVTNLKPQSSFVGQQWATSSKRVVRFDATDGGTVQSYMATSSDAPAFAPLQIIDATGTLSGTAEQNYDNVQLIPTSPADVAPFAEEKTPEPEQGPYISQAPFVPAANNATERHYPSRSSIDGQNATGFKLGTSSLAGVYTSTAIGVEGARTLSFYAVAWTGKTATVYIRVNGGGTINGQTSVAIAPNTGFSGSGNDFTLTGITTTDQYSFALENLTATSTISFSTSPEFTASEDNATGRAVLLGVQLK